MKSHLTAIPASIVKAYSQKQDFDLEVLGVTFTDLLKRWNAVKPDEQGTAVLDLIAPVTIDDPNCDYSTLSSANETTFMKKILQA